MADKLLVLTSTFEFIGSECKLYKSLVQNGLSTDQKYTGT